MKKSGILICADDFGLHADVDAAILDLGEAKRLSVTSVLVDAALHSRDRVLALRDSSLPHGLHFNLTEQIGDLQAQDIRPLGSLILAAVTGRLSQAWVRESVARQLDRYEDLFGQAPSYVDGHQHVHQLPGVRQVLLESLRARYGNKKDEALPWLRNTRAMPGLWRLGMRDAFKANVIETLGARPFVREAMAQGFVVNRNFAGVYDFTRKDAPFDKMMQGWLQNASAGTLIMTHPSRQVVQGDPVGPARMREFEVLRGDALTQWLEAGGLFIAQPASSHSLLAVCES